MSITINDLPLAPLGREGWPWTENGIELVEITACLDNSLKISVVTPSFNQGLYLEETIRSILLQGYSNIEYLIIDGGSKDETLEIIKKYQPFISYWVSEPDSGQGQAINKGFAKSSGDIFYWLNSDDVLAPNTFTKIINKFHESPNIDVVYGDFYYIDENSELMSKFPTLDFSVNLLLERNIIGQPTAFFRKKSWTKFGHVNESWKFILDYELWVRWALQGAQFNYQPKTFAYYRIHETSKTTTLTRVAQNEVIQCYENLLENQKLSCQQMTIFSKVVHNFCNTNYANLDLYQFWKTFYYYVFKLNKIPNYPVLRNAFLALLGPKALSFLRSRKLRPVSPKN
jgi:glycosyltransferase involved in cell wall biosynthesis